MTTLFDDFERSDASPQSESEDNFTFLNRSARPHFAEVRARGRGERPATGPRRR